MSDSIATLKTKLLQLKELHDSGALSAAQYESSRETLERRIIEKVMSGAGADTGGKKAASSTSGMPRADASTGNQSRVSRGFLASLVLGVVVMASAGYLWMGSPANLGTGPSAGTAVADAVDSGQAAPHATGVDQIAAMVDKLAERMKSNPDDAEGWAMLARSYVVLGRQPEALAAYKKAVALRADDPVLLVDYADSLAMNNNRQLAGEPLKLIEKALKLDPRNVKGLALAGTAAFVAKDYAGATKYWEQVVAIGPADSVFVQQVQGGLAEARELGGLSTAKASPTQTPGAGSSAAAALSGKSVAGTVALSASLAKLASPDDTVFVFARAAGGRGMPLAILRKKVSDLPFQFVLDDSLSMSPAALLSGAGTVIVGARVSKSGNAMPQNGDLAGQSDPVSLGQSGLKIEIRDVVKQ